MAPQDTQAGAPQKAQQVVLGPPRTEREQVMDFLFQQCEVKGQIINQQGQQLAKLTEDLQKQTQATLEAQTRITELQAIIAKQNGTAAEPPATPAAA